MIRFSIQLVSRNQIASAIRRSFDQDDLSAEHCLFSIYLYLRMYCNKEYLTVDDFIKNKQPNNTSSLKILQINIRGMNDLAKFDGIKEMLQRYGDRIDIVVIGETWLKNDRTCLYSLQGFRGIFSCRNESHGGLSVFVRSELNSEFCENRVVDGFHHIHLTLQFHGTFVNCHAIYRPPAFEARRFLSELEQILSKTRRGHECVLIGDVNIPVNLASNNIVQEYLRLLASFSMVISNTCVTRPASNNVLDHVVCSELLAGDVTNDTIHSDLSDHCLILSTFKNLNIPTIRILQKQIIDHQRLNHLFFESMAGLSHQLTPNEKLSYVIESYNSLLQQCTRIVSVRARVKGHCPWMTFDLWKLIQLKENALKSKRRNPDDQRLVGLLEHISKKLQIEKASCKRNYYNNLLSRGNQKMAWKVINDVMGRKQQHILPDKLCINGNIITNVHDICQSFNEFFCGIGPSLAASINSNRDINRFETLIPCQSSLFLSPASVNEIIILINELVSKKSPGPDNIPVSFVKNHHVFFATLLTEVFNELSESGVYPDCLKIARVIPVHKSGDPKDPSNYRPISCLSVLDKIIEKLLVSRIVQFTNQHRLIYEHQYGFRHGMSTLTASCDLVENIYDSLDSRQIVGALFIDLKKAFDTIDHTLLIEKLDYFGIRGLVKSLITSYLSNRHQFVAVGEYKSTLRPVSTGVPQGSNLGPILFLLFINDLGNLHLHGKLRLFADDTSVFYNGSDCVSIQQHIKEDLMLLNDFFQVNLLSMNLLKTKYMLIHSPRRRLPPRDPVSVSNHTVEEVSSFPFLGLILDNTMSWTAHLDSLKRKLASLCGIFRKVSSFLPATTLKTLYYSLFHSRLQYLVANWGLASKSALRELQVIQNRSLKIIFRKPLLYPTRMLYEDPSHSILPIRALQEFQMLVHLRSSSASTISTLTSRRMHEARSSRQTGHFYLPRPHTEFGRKKISYIGCKTYNALPPSCKNASSLAAFKRHLVSIIKAKIANYIV